jgi:hypothetical protein
MLADLTAEEVVMLGHALQMVPGNACLTGESATQLGGKGILFFTDAEAFKTLWNKVAEAIRDRDDVAPFRSPAPKKSGTTSGRAATKKKARVLPSSAGGRSES